MTVSLVLMLAAESYCKCRFVAQIPSSDFCLVLYKLIRFYQPSSYGTLRLSLCSPLTSCLDIDAISTIQHERP